MTGYTVHTGASKKFVSGWDRVFSTKAGVPSEKVTGEQGAGKKGKNSSGKKKKKKK